MAEMTGRRSYAARPGRRAGILFFEDYAECDCCDKKTKIAIIHFGVIDSYNWNVCKDCLYEFYLRFFSETEIRKMKLKQLQ
jgi:hypothetical protein